MISVLRSHGFRFVIYSNDHQPAHVHVIGRGEAKINLAGEDGRPELVWAKGMSRADIRLAYGLVEEHRLKLLAKWIEMHGAID